MAIESAERFIEMCQRYPYAKSRLLRAWIRFWYSDTWRLFTVLLPGSLIVVVPLLYLVGVPAEYMGKSVAAAYFGIFLWAMGDNDFENRWRVGETAYKERVDMAPIASKVFSSCSVPVHAALQVIVDTPAKDRAQAALDARFGPDKVFLRSELRQASAADVRAALQPS